MQVNITITCSKIGTTRKFQYLWRNPFLPEINNFATSVQQFSKNRKKIYINKICVCKRPLPRCCTFKLNCMYFWIIAHCCKGKFYPNPSYSHQNTTNQAITHSSIKGAGQYMRSRRVGHQFANVTTYTNINLPKNIKKKSTLQTLSKCGVLMPSLAKFVHRYILNKHIILALK